MESMLQFVIHALLPDKTFEARLDDMVKTVQGKRSRRVDSAKQSGKRVGTKESKPTQKPDPLGIR
jgi:hypothetical protein